MTVTVVTGSGVRALSLVADGNPDEVTTATISSALGQNVSNAVAQSITSTSVAVYGAVRTGKTSSKSLSRQSLRPIAVDFHTVSVR